MEFRVESRGLRNGAAQALARTRGSKRDKGEGEMQDNLTNRWYQLIAA